MCLEIFHKKSNFSSVFTGVAKHSRDIPGPGFAMLGSEEISASSFTKQSLNQRMKPHPDKQYQCIMQTVKFLPTLTINRILGN